MHTTELLSPARFWILVVIDLIGPLQEALSGNKYIVSVTDHFCQNLWFEAAGIPDKLLSLLPNVCIELFVAMDVWILQ